MLDSKKLEPGIQAATDAAAASTDRREGRKTEQEIDQAECRDGDEQDESEILGSTARCRLIRWPEAGPLRRERHDFSS